MSLKIRPYLQIPYYLQLKMKTEREIVVIVFGFFLILILFVNQIFFYQAKNQLNDQKPVNNFSIEYNLSYPEEINLCDDPFLEGGC